MTPCDSLDDFVTDQLAELERTAFVSHLDGCDECRDAVRLHALLAGATLPVPAGLTHQVQRRLTRERRRRWATAGLLAASLLLGVWLARPLVPMPRPVEEIARVPETSPVEVVAHFEGDVIVRPMDTGEPTVTAYWIYPNFARNTKDESR